VDNQADTIDFLLTDKRDKKAALRFLARAIDRSGKPGLINIDKSGSNTAAIRDYNHAYCERIEIRQCKFLNSIVEQDHRRIERECCPILEIKSFDAARKTLAGIESINMPKKG